LGWKAAWLSEIEPFPSAVLAHHYPDVPNLGDMTLLPERILSGEVEAPDVFCGGTPCQAFSVAGLRNSLDDARGNLSLTFVGIANAIDHVRSVRSDAPAIIFWENVPGVLSTKDNAFGCFLGALAGEDDPIIPSGEKWTNAGCVYGPQRTVAWRVLDAQYFGVAQRRRRVFVVASARADFDPAAVLFEFDSVRRDTAPSRETGKESAGVIGDGASKRSWPAEVSSTLDTTFGTKQGLEDQHVNAGCPLFVLASTVQTLRTRRPGEGGMSADHEHLVPVVSPALNTCSGSHHAPDTKAYVVEPISIHPHCIGRAPEAGAQGKEYLLDGSAYCMDSRGQPQAVAHVVGALACNTGPNGHDAGNFACNQAVDAGHVLPVAQPMVLMDQGGSVMNVEHDMVGTLRRETHGHEPVVMQPMAYNIAPGKGELKDDIHVTDAKISKTIDASGSNPSMHQGGAAIVQTMAVRRLTPVECERLQGFPDNYTNISWRKKDESPDGPRYKALGNSWAVPNVRWIGKRIQESLK
jgi:DNA (cytosine-5)-methyltransferase 1